MLFSPFRHLLLFLTDRNDLFGFFESSHDNLVQSLLVNFGFSGKFFIVKRYSLVQNTWNLLEKFTEILFKLWCQLFKKTLNRCLDFLPVYVLNVLINSFINEFHCGFESLNSWFKFFKLFHHSLNSDINNCLNKSPLGFFQIFALSFVFDTGLDSVSLAFLIFKLLFFLNFVFDGIWSNFLFEFFLSKRRLQ